MDELRRQVDDLFEEVALLRRQLDERDARIAELEAELKRRGKKYTPKANAPKSSRKKNRPPQETAPPASRRVSHTAGARREHDPSRRAARVLSALRVR